jgi:CO/xanthine dehydrogenase FAD-binding subunit
LGGPVGTNGLADCLKAVREAIAWDRERAKPRSGRGLGVAVGEHLSGAYSQPDGNRSDAAIDLYADGHLRVRSGCSDAGTGQKTILGQIAADELGVPLERISVYSMDTDDTPWDLGAFSSRGTHYTGHAVGLTAREFAERLKRLAAQKLGTAEVRLEDGFACSAVGKVPLGDLVSTSNEAVDGVLTHQASYVDSNVEMRNPAKLTATHNYAAQAAVVQVDGKTGKVRVVDYVVANDSGTALNPMLLEGQLSGAVVMGLGAALGEEMIFEQGKLVNPAFLHYPVPRAADVPPVRTILKGVSDSKGPYGAKAVGELGITATGPCIANAVYDAIGVRIRSLPITPDKIINGLAEKEGRRRQFHLWRRPARWYTAVVRWAYPRGLLKILHERQVRHAKAAWSPAPPIQSIETPEKLDDLIRALGPDAAIVGGGTDLQLRRRQHLAAPKRLVSVARVTEMLRISAGENGPIVVGGGVTLAKLAEAVRSKLPALAQAIDEIATPQVRNVATVAGNLRQEKRCWFFRNGFNCYKRMGEATLAPCYAVEGDHRFYHAAIDGHRCQAITPSDLATILTALDATATIVGPSGTRESAIEKLYTGPGELAIGEQEVLTQIAIPADAISRRTAFKKLNLWQGDFAVASAAISARLDEAGRCTDARICLGAVAPVPFRARATERWLIGRHLAPETLRARLDRELDARAHPLKRNVWKLDAVAGLAERAVEAIMAPIEGHTGISQ